MKNRIITMESLVEFCKTQKAFSFSAQKVGHPLVVSTYGKLEYSSEDDDGLMKVHLKACHTELNRNGSYIADEDMTRALSSLANKPILAEIVFDENKEADFGTHAIEEIETEDGQKKLYYIEHPVGIMPESCGAHLVYDDAEEKNFVHADGYVFTLYGNESADILKRRNGVDCSVELEIYEFAWDGKNNWLSLKDFIFNGVTLLGAKYAPGMKGARCELSDFSNYTSQDYSKELNEMKARLFALESRFNKNSKEGGNQVDKLNELLAQYNKTLEDLDFEYEGLSDEELEAKFAEVFADDNNDTPSNDNESSDNSNEGDNAEPTSEGGEGGESDNSDDTNEGDRTIPIGQVDDDDSTGTKKNSEFALSLQEKINALQNLVAITYEEADNEWYCTIVYDSYLVMIGYWKGQAYKQNYKEENGEFTLTGDRVRVYEQFLTQEEIDTLESMKSEFSALKEFKSNVEKADFEAKKNELIEDSRFDSIRETEEFKKVISEAEKYSLEELETQFKLIFADIELANRNFEQKPISQQKSGKMFRLPSKGGNPVESKYGGIFSE